MRIQCRTYPLLILHQRPDLLLLHFSATQLVCGLAIGSSFTHALPSISTSSRFLVHDNRQLLSTFALYRDRVRLCPGRVCG
ncbi:hypothetical protein EDD85DRAFT_1030112 [Armillaria nabsnona]|nr:hypothetical protein EDD85DRAFT_1030112 [Armillaria nabsnona]